MPYNVYARNDRSFTGILPGKLTPANRDCNCYSLLKVTRKSMRISFPEVDQESLLYLAGYIAWKLQKKGLNCYGTKSRFCNLGEEFFQISWLGILSRGGLMVSTDELQESVKSCEIEFRRVIDVFAKSRYCDKKLYYYICKAHPQIQSVIIEEFVKIRIRIRVKYMNQVRRNKSRAKNLKLKQFVKSSK